MGDVSFPLKTWEQVCTWAPGADDCCVASVPLADSGSERPARPRVIVCHDMAGGYLQDKFAHGSPDGEAYHFFHWKHVDTFIYFSHYFVTIPPPGWMNAAHTHGTKVLGTVITEWDDGKEHCKRFVESMDSVTQFVSKLVAIAQYYNFDGWLINIENPIEEPEAVGHLLYFVQLLTEKMHAASAHSEVIWYDSVTCEGKLKWQDELNDLNCCYFDACDGIFLNYTWKDEGLARSAELAKNKERLHDVYVGVDVFGRNCRGGGGFNTVEALQAISMQNLSIAIFAQGWVYEKLGKENFPENECKFWGLIHEYLPLREVNQLPMVSNFCRGQGCRLYMQGQVLSEGPWTHLSLQAMQPNLAQQPTDGDHQLYQYTAEAYSGGSCLRLSGDVSKGNIAYFRLFNLNFPVSQLFVCCCYKPLDEHSQLALALKLTYLCEGAEEEEESCGGDPLCLVEMGEDKRAEMFQHYEMTSPQATWKTIVQELTVPDSYKVKAKSVGVKLSSAGDSGSYDVLLGQLSVFTEKQVSEVPAVTDLSIVQKKLTAGKVDLLLCCHLKWCSTGAAPCHYVVYHRLDAVVEPAAKPPKLASDWAYCGVSHVPEYQVRDWAIPRDTKSVTFLIRPVSVLNLPVLMEHLPTCTIPVNTD